MAGPRIPKVYRAIVAGGSEHCPVWRICKTTRPVAIAGQPQRFDDTAGLRVPKNHIAISISAGEDLSVWGASHAVDRLTLPRLFQGPHRLAGPRIPDAQVVDRPAEKDLAVWREHDVLYTF